MPQNDAPVHFEVKSIVAQRNHEGYVVIRLGTQEAQVTPAEARTHARWLMEAAEAADQDAFLYRFFNTKVGLDNEEIAALITEFREDREHTRAE